MYGAVCGGYCCQTYGWSEQKNCILKSRKDMFSYPMRRGGAPQGGPRDRGGSQVPLGGVHHNLVGDREGGGADTSWKERAERGSVGEGRGRGGVRGGEWPREKEREGERNE